MMILKNSHLRYEMFQGNKKNIKKSWEIDFLLEIVLSNNATSFANHSYDFQV